MRGKVMPSLIENFESGKALKKELQILLEALGRAYEPFPDDPRQDFFVCALNCMMFMRGTLIEMSKSDDADLLGSGAIRLAVELDEIKVFSKLLSQEVEDIKGNNPDDLDAFLDQMRKLAEGKNAKDDWLRLITNVANL